MEVFLACTFHQACIFCFAILETKYVTEEFLFNKWWIRKNFNKSSIPPWIIFTFLSCANDTQSHDTSHMLPCFQATESSWCCFPTTEWTMKEEMVGVLLLLTFTNVASLVYSWNQFRWNLSHTVEAQLIWPCKFCLNLISRLKSKYICKNTGVNLGFANATCFIFP